MAWGQKPIHDQLRPRAELPTGLASAATLIRRFELDPDSKSISTGPVTYQILVTRVDRPIIALLPCIRLQQFLTRMLIPSV